MIGYSEDEARKYSKESTRLNILEDFFPSNGFSEEMNGISYRWYNGECTAPGTSTDYSQSHFFFDKYVMPERFVSGRAYNFVNKNIQVNGSISMKLYKESDCNTINNIYTTEHYENTSDITAESVLTPENDYYLSAPGDTRNMTGTIQTILNSNGVCRLGPGDFYVTGIEIPNYGMLIGSGNSTRIILDAGLANGYAVKLKNYGCVKDLRVVGSIEPIETVVIENASTVGGRHGILFEGTADNTEKAVTYYCSTVENCAISDFVGGGITCYNTGLSPSANLLVSDVHIARCGAGINVSYFSEYHRWTNINATQCYYGCICNGGNNNFSNCDFSENVVGLLIDNSIGQSNNNSHGTFDACSFNHSNHNEGIAIRIIGAYAGEIFTGCQIFFGKIVIEDSTGIRFSACNFGRQVPLDVKNSTVVTYSDSTFYSTDASSVVQSGNTSLSFTNCYQRDGAQFNPVN